MGLSLEVEVFGEGKEEIASITVFYRTSHRRKVYELALERLLRMRLEGHTAVLVVNGSPDDTYEFVRKKVKELSKEVDKKIYLLKTKENLGFAYANLLGYEVVKRKAEMVMLVNDDMVVYDKGVRRIVEVLKGSTFAGATGLVLGFDGKPQTGGLYLCHYKPVQAFEVYKKALREPHMPTYLTGAFSVYKVKDLEECGGLFKDPSFMYFDDSELGLRLWRCGKEIVALPIPAGFHYWGGSTVKTERRRLYIVAGEEAVGRQVRLYPPSEGLKTLYVALSALTALLAAITKAEDALLSRVSFLAGYFSSPKGEARPREPRLLDWRCLVPFRRLARPKVR